MCRPYSGAVGSVDCVLPPFHYLVEFITCNMLPCLCPPFPRLAQIVYARLLRLLYKLQLQVWRLVRKHDPQPYEHSVLGFLEPRLRMLSRVSEGRMYVRFGIPTPSYQ